MKKLFLKILAAALALMLCLCAAAEETDVFSAEGETWNVGFGRRQIVPEEGMGPLYIAGYNQGWEIDGVYDYCEARAIWLDVGGEGVVLISVDCVGLASGTVSRIREALSDLENCAAINVCSTHTHAGIDTLGLWGPAGFDGKNDAYMSALVQAAEEAAREAAANRRPGTMFLGSARTEGMQRDSRFPDVYDPNLYQLRFEAEDGPGVRLFIYGAHPESLRGSNRMLSRDFAGVLCDLVQESTGDDTLFFAGSVGGLIMTHEFISTDRDAEGNLRFTGERLAEYALSIQPSDEQPLAPQLGLGRTEFSVPMDNLGFMYYKFLGILENECEPGESATGYHAVSELSVLTLDDAGLVLVPGEIFTELVDGSEYGEMNPDGVNPAPLKEIAAAYGVENMMVIGLANDELGYIVPPSDFLLNERTPYLARTMDKFGEDHYEETNSVGPECAQRIADAMDRVLSAMEK